MPTGIGPSLAKDHNDRLEISKYPVPPPALADPILCTAHRENHAEADTGLRDRQLINTSLHPVHWTQ